MSVYLPTLLLSRLKRSNVVTKNGKIADQTCKKMGHLIHQGTRDMDDTEKPFYDPMSNSTRFCKSVC